MCIQQLSPEFREKFGMHLPIQQAYWTINYIIHDYENIGQLPIHFC